MNMKILNKQVNSSRGKRYHEWQAQEGYNNLEKLSKCRTPRTLDCVKILDIEIVEILISSEV